MSGLLRLFYVYASLLTISITECYDGLSYAQIFFQFEELSRICPKLIKVDYAETRYSIQTKNVCDTCKIQMIFMTDFDTIEVNRPAIYISGELEGTNTIGPAILLQFAQFFCYQKTTIYPWINNLLKKRIIIMTPLTNTYGYINRKDEDFDTYNMVQKSPADDFLIKNPKNNSTVTLASDNLCVTTGSVMVMEKIFTEFPFIESIFLKSDKQLGFKIPPFNKKDVFFYSAIQTLFYKITGISQTWEESISNAPHLMSVNQISKLHNNLRSK